MISLAPLGEWLLKSVLLPCLAEWFSSVMQRMEGDAQFKSQARLAHEALQNAKTKEERAAARRLIRDL